MPEGVQIHSLTSNRLLYDRAGAAGSPAIAANPSESADRTATWVSMVDQSSTTKADRQNCIERLKRMARYRLVMPLKRSRHSPGYVARSVSVGLFWAMTPTIGVQMAMVLVHWLAVRKIGRWEFNVIHAWAWTWVTNVATVLPVYYSFYVTGQLLLGHWDDVTGYHGFLKLWDTSFGVGEDGSHLVTGIEMFWSYFDVVVGGWGLTMLIGSIPYAIVGAWIGYAWSMRIVVSHRRAVLGRRLHRHDRHMAAGSRGET